MDKTKEQLQAEIDLLQKLKDERGVSDDRYAVKLVERIVFGLLAFIAVTLLGWWLTVQIQPKAQAPEIQPLVQQQ